MAKNEVIPPKQERTLEDKLMESGRNVPAPEDEDMTMEQRLEEVLPLIETMANKFYEKKREHDEAAQESKDYTAFATTALSSLIKPAAPSNLAQYTPQYIAEICRVADLIAATMIAYKYPDSDEDSNTPA